MIREYINYFLDSVLFSGNHFSCLKPIYYIMNHIQKLKAVIPQLIYKLYYIAWRNKELAFEDEQELEIFVLSVAFRLAAVDIQALIKLILGVFLWDKVAVV